MPTKRWQTGVWAILLAMSLGGSGAAEPLDLQDTTPRWVEVRFEVSPADQPGSTDQRWSGYRRAWLTVDPEGSAVEIRVPAEEVEAQLRSQGTDPVAGSFSPFVWRVEPSSGHVLEAELSGRVRERIRLGPFGRSVEVQVEAVMSTFERAGFVTSKQRLGIETHSFCDPALVPGRCQEVFAVPFDRNRGYVNAVGFLRATAGLIEIQSFSPLGEVQFRERPARALETTVSGSPVRDEVCSPARHALCLDEPAEES
jgi:hypothetical protein